MLLGNKMWYEQRFDKNDRKRFWKIVVVVVLIVFFMFHQYWKALIYPFIYGTQHGIEQKISIEDYFEDVQQEPFYFERNGSAYYLTPKTKYRATGRVGITEHYDGWRNKFYRGYFKNSSQHSYIDLVPQDVFLVIGKMAEPEIFKMFNFVHEERNGGVKCKGVKYRTSSLFSQFGMSRKKWEKNQKKYEKCNPYIKKEESNNYHPIPANKNINAALSILKHGDVVSLEGFLVDVSIDGKKFLETATRHSQIHPWARIGGQVSGWCFVLYTTKIIVNGVLYE